MKSNEQEKSFSLVFYRLEEVQLVSALELWPFPDTHNELRALIGPWHIPKKNLSYCKFCFYTHPVNLKFTI